MALIIALAAPPPKWPIWMSFLMIGVAPAVQYYVFWEPSQRAEMGEQEPWITIAFTISCVLLWLHRWKLIETSRREAIVRARAMILEKFAHLLLGAQHLTNSPLQIIDAQIHLLGKLHPESKDRIEIIRRALAAVKRVSSLLAIEKLRIRWDQFEAPTNIQNLESAVKELSTEIDQTP
ncbi:MAG: hypothetical protein ACXVA9_03400 [Bdellovibrionales bacterium]